MSNQEIAQQVARNEYFALEDAYKILSKAVGQAASGSMVAYKKVDRIKDYIDGRMTEEFGTAFAQ